MIVPLEECNVGKDSILVLDFGGQYGHLIARRLREMGFFALHIPAEHIPLESLTELILDTKAIVLSGGPLSVWEKRHDNIAAAALLSGRPILGICYGHQLLAKQLGARVGASPKPEFGPSRILLLDREDPLFSRLPQTFTVWFSHNDAVLSPAKGMRVLAVSPGSPIAAFKAEFRGTHVYGVQWHPEVSHTQFGAELLEKWAVLAGVEKGWSPSILHDCILQYARRLVRENASEGPIVAAVSGGVDSTVAAVIVGRIVGERLIPVIIDHGLHPSGEIERAVHTLQSVGLRPQVIGAAERFLSRLRGVSDPEEKRRIVSEEYFNVLLEVINDVGAVALVQGTIYPDLIESGALPGADKIKSHHNVALKSRLPENVKLIEPLAWLYKDEVRRIGRLLGLPDEILYKQPIPGPGLAVRIEGEVTREKIMLVRRADEIVRNVIESRGLHRRLWQYFAVLTSSRATGVKGDKRVYGSVIAVRIVESQDAMTARVARIDLSVLEEIAGRIASLPGVSRVVYDITSKPPATIEWE